MWGVLFRISIFVRNKVSVRDFIIFRICWPPHLEVSGIKAVYEILGPLRPWCELAGVPTQKSQE